MELPVSSQVPVRLGWGEVSARGLSTEHGWDEVGRVQPVMIPELARWTRSRLIHSVPVSEVNCAYLTRQEIAQVYAANKQWAKVDPECPGSGTSLLSSSAMLLQYPSQP